MGYFYIRRENLYEMGKCVVAPGSSAIGTNMSSQLSVSKGLAYSGAINVMKSNGYRFSGLVEYGNILGNSGAHGYYLNFGKVNMFRVVYYPMMKNDYLKQGYVILWLSDSIVRSLRFPATIVVVLKSGEVLFCFNWSKYM